MSERDKDREDLAASKRAVEDAETATGEIDKILASIHRSSAAITSVVQPNGYVQRFREMLRGA